MLTVFGDLRLPSNFRTKKLSINATQCKERNRPAHPKQGFATCGKDKSWQVRTVIPVPHDITGYVSCALAGTNAQCSFTVVIGSMKNKEAA